MIFLYTYQDSYLIQKGVDISVTKIRKIAQQVSRNVEKGLACVFVCKNLILYHNFPFKTSSRKLIHTL